MTAIISDYTPCPEKNGWFGICLITQSNLGQISISGTVLKSACSQLSKTVPDFEIWSSISWENGAKRHLGSIVIADLE